MSFVTTSQLYLAVDSIFLGFLPLMTHLQKSSLLLTIQLIVIFSSNHPLSILNIPLQTEWMLLSSSWVAHPSLHTSSLHLTSGRSSWFSQTGLQNLIVLFHIEVSLCFENIFLGLLCSSGLPVGFGLLVPWTTHHLPFWNSWSISSSLTSRLQNTIGETHRICFTISNE